ncbi:MAG TPA: EamA family transporter [Gemmatimonadales bacterium]
MRWKIAIAFLCVYVFWGTTYLAMRVAVEEIPPTLMAGSRFVLAGVVLFVWAVALVNVDWGLTNPFGRRPLPQTGGPRDY